MKTQRTRLIEALTGLGYETIPAKTGKYTTFKAADDRFYFVGKAGALRFGKTSASTKSISLERTGTRKKLLDSVPA